MNPYQPGEDNQDPYEVGYKAGAASRDAEIAGLKHAIHDFTSAMFSVEQERNQLRNELEIERMRNVACGVVAMADTPDSAKQARDMHPDYMSAACSDVARRVDECIKLREQVKMLSAWIKQQGEITDTCTFNILREVCENCACHRNKVLAATEPK